MVSSLWCLVSLMATQTLPSRGVDTGVEFSFALPGKGSVRLSWVCGIRRVIEQGRNLEVEMLSIFCVCFGSWVKYIGSRLAI